MEYILIFENTYKALECERVLKLKNLDLVILPSPSYITNSCGIAIGVKNENLEMIYDLIEREEIFVKNIYDNKTNKLIK